jgi:HlyD family secretion protein
VSTAQDASNSDATKQQSAVQSAQNVVAQAQASVAKAEASLANTIAAQTASLQNAQNAVDSARAALSSQVAAAAQSTAGSTQADIDAATAQVANAEAALNTAQNNLAAATLVAPSAGTVASINDSVGQFVGSGNSNSLVTLTDLSAPQIEAQVSEADIGKIQSGQKATFTVSAYPARTFNGTVATIEPAGTTTSNVVTYTVSIAVDPSDVHLLPGMTATVTIVTQEAHELVTVPTSAVHDRTVNVLRNGHSVPVQVQTGISYGIQTQIISGLQPGDQVVTAVRKATS